LEAQNGLKDVAVIATVNVANPPSLKLIQKHFAQDGFLGEEQALPG